MLKITHSCKPPRYILFSGFIGIVLCILTVGNTGQAQDISKINLAHNFDLDSEVRIKHKLVTNQSLATVFVQIRVQDISNFWKDYRVIYQVADKYNHKAIQDFEVTDQQSISDKDGVVIIKADITLQTGSTICILKITNLGTQRDFYFDIPIIDPFNFKPTSFYLADTNTNDPIFKSFMPGGGKLKIVSTNRGSEKIYGFRYSFDFDNALPPMQQRKATGSKSMTIDSAFQVNIGQPFSLRQEGLYFFQEDTTTLEGISFRITDKYFPKPASVDALIDPMVYLTTRLEYKSLINTENRKKAMDSFWLKIGKTKDRAKRIIRNYFSNVERSNRLFSHYKAGWKTDKGMIYIIFGPPEEVYKTEGEESWIYNKKENMSKIKFTFVKVKNIFTRDHYELKRDNSYEKYWYRTIDLWRKGRKGI